MEDDLLKRLLIDIVVNADEGIGTEQKLRSATEALKQSMKELQAQTGETFEVLRDAKKIDFLGPLKNQVLSTLQAIKSVRSEIKSLNSELKSINSAIDKKQKLIDTPNVDKIAIQEELDQLKREQVEIQTQINGLNLEEVGLLGNLVNQQKQLTIGTMALSRATSELNKETGQIKDVMLEPSEGAAQFTSNVAQAKEEIMQLVSAGHSLDAAFQGVTRSGQFTSVESRTAMNELKSEIKDADDETRNLEDDSESLGHTISTFIDMMAVKAVEMLIQKLKVAAQEGLDFANSLISMEIQVRALERAGFDTTIQEWTDYVSYLDDAFTQFTQKSIQNAVAIFLRLQRQSTLTTDEIKELIEASAILATVWEVDLQTAAIAVSRAVGTGYARSMWEIVGSMKETTIQQEAIARGYATATEDVDDQMRAMVALEIVQEEALAIGTDINLLQDETSKKVTGITSDITDQTGILGEQLLPAWKGLLEVVLWVLEGIEKALIPAQNGLIAYNTVLVGTILTLKDIGGNVWDRITGNVDHLTISTKRFEEAYDKLQRMIRPDLFSGLAKDIKKFAKEEEEATVATVEFTDEAKKLYEDMRDVIIGTVQDIAQEWRKYELDTAQAEEKFLQDQAQRYQDYLLDIAQAEQDFALSQKQAYESYLLDVSQVNDDYNQSIADANEEYRKNEIKAEQDFQEDLRKLREQFLFDLEDALRERDAKQVLQLIRQYDLEKEQLARQRELEQDDAAQKLADDLANLEEEKNAKLQQMQEEFNLSQQQAQEKFNLEQQQRAESYALEQQQAAENYALLQKQREEDHLARLKEIEIQGQERLEALRQAFEDEYNLTVEQAKLITDALTAYFGPGGPGEAAYKYLYEMGAMYTQALADTVLAMFEMLNAAVNALSGAMSPLPPEAYTGSNPNPPVAYATGGTLLATRPTVALFGEGGEPEIVQFTPLSKYKGNVNQLSGGIGGSSEQRIRLEVLLSPDLVSRVIDQSVGVVADVIEGKIL